MSTTSTKEENEVTANSASECASPAAKSTNNPTTTGTNTTTEFEPPLACVRRLLKKSLPSSTNVGKDASSAFARACGIFVIYLTACANDFAREHKRQTITANDIMAAIQELDFDEFTPQLSAFLDQHRKEEKAKRERKKVIESKKNDEDNLGRKHAKEDSVENNQDGDDTEEDKSLMQQNKKMKIEDQTINDSNASVDKGGEDSVVKDDESTGHSVDID